MHRQRHASGGATSMANNIVHDEDAWKLDESDGEDGITSPGSSGIASSSKASIAKVAQQAGLGRKIGGSPNSSVAASQASASPTGHNTALPTPVANGSTLSVSAGSAQSRSFSSSTTSKATPQPAKDRARQPSYGLWERLTGLGAAISGSGSGASNSGGPGDADSAASGYTRFDDTVELEDNFDGTYSVSAASLNRPSSASGQSKLLSPANVPRPSLLGASASGGRSSSSIPRVPSTSATALSLNTGSTSGKGKGKLDSPGAVVVGSPRPRSPQKHWRDIPQDADGMRRAIRKDLSDVLNDPVYLLSQMSIDDPSESSSAFAKQQRSGTSNGSDAVLQRGESTYDSPNERDSPNPGASEQEEAKKQSLARRNATRKRKFKECLGQPTVDVAGLRKLAWAGIPAELRPMTWQILLGYLPAPSVRRASVLARKRQEYAEAVRSAFHRGESAMDAQLWHQIRIDVPRTNPGVPLWQFPSTQKSLERILYVWAIRHPASGYVQGINDLATPFFQVFLSTFIDCPAEEYDVSALPEAALMALEADTFWCLSKLLDGIQDNYISNQPGIQRQVARCQELCLRVDAPLARHLEAENIPFLQFSFRWFHLLFLRVLPVSAVIRMWDTYLSEGSDAFSSFHTYVCLAFLLRFSEKLRAMDFQGITLFLQDPVDHDTWSESMTEMLLSEAYMWSALWSGTKKPT